ncbi:MULTISPECIES: MFS transporter [unclassified Streptomyces]|uniref:MFS transporter n=1 Tax=unclassified Streptomyces TaxID=2593676 RepID=UPI00380D7E38
MSSQSSTVTAAQGESAAAGVKPGAGIRRKGLLLLGLSLGYFMVLLDTSVVNVALPAIRDDIGGGLSGLQWVVNGYTLTFAALLLTMGALSDRFGARRVFLAGTWAFLVASGLTAAAPDLGVLIGMRGVLGIAGAALLPASMAVIATACTDPAERARALGSWAAITGVALAAGPVVGGVLTDTLGWRFIFVINVPVALLSVFLTRAFAPQVPRNPDRAIDLPGQLLAVLALAGLTFGVIQSEPEGWTSAPVLIALAVGVAAAIGFLAVERREPGVRGPMLPLKLFRNSAFSVGLLNGLLVNFGLSGVLFVMSLHFQQGLGYTAMAAGLAFLPLTLPTAFNPICTGRLVARKGPRVPSILGFSLMTLGALIQLLFVGDVGAGQYALTAVGLLVFGFGVSFAIPSLVTTLVSAVPKEQAGIASGALNSARQTGAVVGVAVLGSFLQASPGDSGTKTALAVAAAALAVGALLAVGYIGRGAAR